MNNSNQYIFAALLAFFSTLTFGQQGPGGVSVETPQTDNSRCRPDTSSTCGMWLDASSLTSFADGDDVTLWQDVSISHDCDDASVPNNVNPPIFRNDPAYTINGLPTITFEDNRHFILASSIDLNTEKVTYDKIVFMAFRASEDITTKQVIYEEGGTVRGFNIMIEDGNLIIGAYDKQSNDNDDEVPGDQAGDSTPAWGYSYVSSSIQPNTTYILTATFHADTYGVIDNNANYYLKGWLNGQPFGGPGQLTGGFNGSGFNSQGKLGTLYDHPNPCGLGAVNDDAVNKDGIVINNSGSLAFKGKLAEMCYYKDVLSDTQRIIIENYLASKYIATLVTHDYYEYQFNFGKDLIGIGHGASESIHNLSRGRNPFVISAQTFSTTDNMNRYVMVGHNGLNNLWTAEGVPRNSTNIQRLKKIWRVDRTNMVNDIKISLDVDKLPNLPIGYSTSNAKLVLLVDETNAHIPDFSLSTTVVKEIPNFGYAPYDYEITYNIPDGAFFTFAWLKPEVNFDVIQAIAIEADTLPYYQTENIGLSLNYDPVNNGDAIDDGYTVDYTFLNGTATLGTGPGVDAITGDDYYYDLNTANITGQSISFNEGVRSVFIPVRIINDDYPEDPATEEFTINLTGTNTTGNSPNLLIGVNDSVPFTIYDDDPDPKISFALHANPISVNEAQDSVYVDIVLIGNPVGTVSCEIKIISGGTTALSNANGLNPKDYDDSFVSNTISFLNQSSETQTIGFPIEDDVVDEATETIQLRLINLSGDVTALSVPALDQIIEIVDNDIPIATFPATGQSGFESIGYPSLLVTLDPISSREVVVDFTMTGGTATYSDDYSGSQSGIVVFPPFANEAFLGPFIVHTDNDNDEGGETVLFDLTGTTPDQDLTLNQPDQLTYTILDYQPFEWSGAGGVGKATDNIIWIDASQEPLGDLANLANRSPYSLDIPATNNPAENIANTIGGQNALEFNGVNSSANADAYQIENSTKINIAGTVDRLSYFFVFKPTDVPNSAASPNNPNTNHARIIYEQGGGSRGTSIYLYNDTLFFHAWNNVNDDGDDNITTTEIEGDKAPWGNNGNSGNSLFAKSAQKISANSNYIVSCHYNDTNATNPLTVYVNGVQGTMSDLSAGTNQFGVGRLWGHSGAIGFGADINNTRVHFSNGTMGTRKAPFKGFISEFISFHEPEMSEVRRVIIENYLSGKYNILLDDSDTKQAWNLSDPLQDSFSHDIAGLGQEVNPVSAHTDSRGPTSILRVKGAQFNSINQAYLMWGHNNESLTNTWPYSNPSNNLPSGVHERSGQVWKFYETGDVTQATITINFGASDSAAALSASDAFLKLLVHTNTDPQDFGNAAVYSLTGGQNPTGNTAVFNNVPISNNMYLTLGNTGTYSGTPLPIELLSFSAKLSQNKVDLNWVTSTEINNEYFVIERADADLRWNDLMQVNGAGNSNTTLFYNEVDYQPLRGISYYRLRQVDYDGSYTYSEIISVNNNSSDKREFYLYPNPNSTGTVYLNIPDSDGKPVTISMFDISGKLLFQKLSNPDTATNLLTYSSLESGVYVISIRSDKFNATKKLVIE